MLCKKFGLDPLADGVVISHREGHARGIATNHGDPEHLWKGLGLPYTMDGFRKAVYGNCGFSEVCLCGAVYCGSFCLSVGCNEREEKEI